MAGRFRFFGGRRESLPSLDSREPGFCVDTGELFIGGEGGNRLIASEKAAAGEFDKVTLGSVSLREEGGRLIVGDGKEAVVTSHGVLESLPADATLKEVIGALNALLETLK